MTAHIRVDSQAENTNSRQLVISADIISHGKQLFSRRFVEADEFLSAGVRPPNREEQIHLSSDLVFGVDKAQATTATMRSARLESYPTLKLLFCINVRCPDESRRSSTCSRNTSRRRYPGS